MAAVDARMSDLPTRMRAFSALHHLGYPEEGDREAIVAIVSLFISGCLVDREAIDYEVGLAYLLKIWEMVYGKPNDKERAVLWDGIQGGVAAAIGDGDE